MCKFKTFCDTRIIAVFVVLSCLLHSDAKNQPNFSSNCKSIQSQTSYLMNEMSGFWYGIEIVEHTHTRFKPTADSCIKIDLQDGGKDTVYLTWRERSLGVTYQFHIRNTTRRGMWTSLGPQEVAEKPFGYDYEQFAGDVFVVKASDSNAVLTFCSATKLFTLVLSRTHTINSTELDSIHKLLGRFGVPPAKEYRRYCKNSAYSTTHPETFVILFTVFVAFKTYHKYS